MASYRIRDLPCKLQRTQRLHVQSHGSVGAGSSGLDHASVGYVAGEIANKFSRLSAARITELSPPFGRSCLSRAEPRHGVTGINESIVRACSVCVHFVALFLARQEPTRAQIGITKCRSKQTRYKIALDSFEGHDSLLKIFVRFFQNDRPSIQIVNPSSV